jgi:hypothetical protein
MSQIDHSDIRAVLQNKVEHRHSSVTFEQVWDTYSNKKGNKVCEAFNLRKNVSRRIGITAAVAAMLVVALPVAASTISAIVEKRTKEVIEMAKQTKGYVVWDGYYYKATGEAIDLSDIGDKIAEIKRNGNWAIKRSGDTNEFPADSIYAIKETDVKEKIAVRISVGKEDSGPYGYVILRRTDKVEQPDPKTILGAKNDPEEVAIALNNFRELVPFLYEFQGIEQRAQVTLASYSKDFGPGAMLYYRVPEADTVENGQDIQGFIFILEYKKGSEKNVPQLGVRPQSLQPTKTFEMNGIAWNYYDVDHILLLGEKDGIYYEIHTQGNFTYDELIELLKYFKK